LYFRYHRESRIIVYVWLNDEDPERADGSADDAYREIRYLFGNSRLADERLLGRARGRVCNLSIHSHRRDVYLSHP
jgi:hypothetical protein